MFSLFAALKQPKFVKSMLKQCAIATLVLQFLLLEASALLCRNIFPLSCNIFSRMVKQKSKLSGSQQSFCRLSKCADMENSLDLTRNIDDSSLHLSESNIFCNRELNMQHITVVGFDMDYTLAQYKIDFDLLAYNGALIKFVKWCNYPASVLSLKFQENMTRRGCLIDKKRGNILKLDQHRYVKIAEHGLTPLSYNMRKSTYRESYHEAETFTSKDYSNIDTPFSLVDTCLFAQLVDLKDKAEYDYKTSRTKSSSVTEEFKSEASSIGDINDDITNNVLLSKSYQDIWADMRICVDSCHTDGTIKLKVAQDPSKYIIFDPELFPMLQQYRASGRKIFLLTNSLWDYTYVVMNYLQGGKDKCRADRRDLAWLEYFDLVIVGASKPAFLVEDGDKSSIPLYQLNPSTGALTNLDVDIPSATTTSNSNIEAEQMSTTTNTTILSSLSTAAAFLLVHGKVYQGGDAQALHKLLQISNTDHVLYVGDHIYADVLRSKRSVGWRTCLIVPELPQEMIVFREQRNQRMLLTQLQHRQRQLEQQLDALYAKWWQPGVHYQTRGRRNDTMITICHDSCVSDKNISDTFHNNYSRSTTITTSCSHPKNEQQQAYLDWMRVDKELSALRGDIKAKLVEYDRAFHPRWGQLFKAGFQQSRLSKQVKDYACIYTSKVSNLGFISPMKHLRPPRDIMAHDDY